MPTTPAISALQDRLEQVRLQLASMGAMRPGSLASRFRRCGKPGCHCAAPDSPGHGPYWTLTFKSGGKTVTRAIPPHALERTRQQIAAYKRFRTLTGEFVELSEQLCQAQLRQGRESAAAKAKKAFATAFVADIQAEIEALLGQTTADSLDLEAVETAARRGALQVAALALQERLNADGSDWQGPRLPCGCGNTARYAGRRHKTVLTALGPVALRRAYYHCSRCKTGFFPRDRALGLADASLSPAVTRMIGTAAARVSFVEATALLDELAALRVDPKRVERAAEALGREIAADERQHIEPLPPPAPTMYLGLDGTGVPVRQTELAGRAGASSPTAPRRRARSNWSPSGLPSRSTSGPVVPSAIPARSPTRLRSRARLASTPTRSPLPLPSAPVARPSAAASPKPPAASCSATAPHGSGDRAQNCSPAPSRSSTCSTSSSTSARSPRRSMAPAPTVPHPGPTPVTTNWKRAGSTICWQPCMSTMTAASRLASAPNTLTALGCVTRTSAPRACAWVPGWSRPVAK